MHTSYIKTLPPFPARAVDSHKGDFGLGVLLGGSRGMSGAISLAGRAALATGAGLVRLLVPDCILDTVAGHATEWMTAPLASDRKGRVSLSAWDAIVPHLTSATALGVGPGLGRSLGLTALMRRLFQWQNDHTPTKPVVLDADALNAIADWKRLHGGVFPSARFPIILTPHPGEFARLRWEPPPRDPQGRLEAAVRFAKETGTILVLKGHGTVITDGVRHTVNPSGNPGMATGGSGDVLTGILVALLAQRMPPYDAAVLGVFLHGLAGDLAAQEYGPVLTASRIIESLPKAIRYCVQAQERGA